MSDAADGAVPSTAAIPPAADNEAPAAERKTGKRMVALHTGYVGTTFKGSLVNRKIGEGVTVEHCLEIALHRAGFITDANVGDFTKIHFSRASRTDKGVHSLGTVVALRAQLDDALLVGDVEGYALAARVNAHLPPVVRVFAVQKVGVGPWHHLPCVP